MTGGDLVAMGRTRAGLTQRDLADRLGVSQAQLSRVEGGRREPSFAFVQRAARACDLEASLRLTSADGSVDGLVAQQLMRNPLDRLAALVNPDELPGLMSTLGVVGILGAIVVGPVAAGLRGGPAVPPAGRVEVVPADHDEIVAALEADGWLASLPEDPFGGLHSRWRWFAPDPTGWDLELIVNPGGTRGYADLVRHAGAMEAVPVRVAAALDLLRIAHASPWDSDRVRAVELDAIVEASHLRNAA